MICNWLVRGLMCASREVRRRYGARVPGGTSCTETEREIADFLAGLLDGKFDRAKYEMLVAVSGVELAVKDRLWKLGARAVGVDWARCPIGPALELPAVIAGYGVSGALQWLAPYSALVSHVVIADADPGEAFRRYGVDVAVTCFARPRWGVRTVVVTCGELPSVAAAIARALGAEPFTAGGDVVVVVPRP